MADQADVVAAASVPLDAPTSEGDKDMSSADAPIETSVSAKEVEELKNDGTESEMEPAKTNGEAEEPSDAAAPPSDVEMKDISNTIAPAAAAEATPTTPASTRKNGHGSSKKKSSAVPEHKTKKLNRKKSKPILRLNVTPGELYLARMKGHQPWPSIICDEDMLPQILLSTRPVTTALPDGTYKKPEYGEGGKRAGERTYPIMFLYTNEFAWLPNTELTPITPEECMAVADKAKSKNLMEAYLVAAKGHDLAYYKGLLADHQQALEDDNERKAEREAKKVAKEKRKSEVKIAPEAEPDEMDVDEEGSASKPKSKKRKKEADADASEEKPAKTPKTGAKLKLTTPKTPVTESATKKKTPKTKSAMKKAAAKAMGSEDDLDTPKVEEKPLTPAEAKEKKEKEIRYYRHKLQKGFLSRDTIPGEEEIKSMSTYLAKLETYPDLEGSIIRATKIHKVLKAMIRLSSIPKDEEFNFKKRSHDLLSTWNKILADDPNAAADKDDDAKPETNGLGKDADQDDSAADKEAPAEAASPKEADPKEPEKRIGTTIEGEKEADTQPAEPDKPTVDAEADAPNVEDKPAEAYKPVETIETSA